MSCENSQIKTVEELQAEIDLFDKSVLTAIVSKFNNEIDAVKNDGVYDFDFSLVIAALSTTIKERITNKTILLIDAGGYKVKQDSTNLQILHLTWDIKTDIDHLVL